MKHNKRYYYYHDGNQNDISTIYIRKKSRQQTKNNKYAVEIITNDMTDANRLYSYANYFNINLKSLPGKFEAGQYWYRTEVFFVTKSGRGNFVEILFNLFVKTNRIPNIAELYYEDFQEKIKDRLL